MHGVENHQASTAWRTCVTNSMFPAAVPQGGGLATGGLVPAFTVHHELGMQHQIATGLLHLCTVAGATARQPGECASRVELVRPNRLPLLHSFAGHPT